MTLYELMQLVNFQPNGGNMSAELVVVAPDGNRRVSAAVYEIHDDEDQSVTIWLETEEMT